MMRRRVRSLLAVLPAAVVVSTLAVVGVPAIAAAADSDGPGISGDGDTAVITDGDSSSEQTGGGGNGGGGQTVIKIPKPYKEYLYVPNCSANDAEGGADALCGAAVYTCPRDGDIRYRVYTRQHDADGSVAEGADWEVQPGTVCRGPNDPPEGGPVVITTADIADEARKAAPATVVHVEPATKTYVNVPTNFYADDAAQGATVEVLGQQIALQFRPTGFTWSFGDGAKGTGAGVKNSPVGGPGAVEHLYRRSAKVEVTLTRTFEVTYTAPGGVTGTLPAPGVSNTSAPTPLEIGEIQTLVTDGR
jgi:hypothetical protein